ncbi:MAG: RagB/SusD family nutrient uptake outer membrane protein [Pigmentiphaga sp.]|nr:RagB/SusD family nutrient uptake outer membrane protein [Pigmentiphaga sp.]
MKQIINIGIALLSIVLVSCEGFLQREPLDFGNDKAYFKVVDDLMNYNNTFYSLFPGMKSSFWGGVYADDNNSDNQAGTTANNLFYPGDKYTPLVKDSHWKFDHIRNLNYFIHTIQDKIRLNEIAGSPELINHYLGEAYFFKAYEYFRLLSNIGDVPILNDVLSENYDELIVASKRSPRNEVARYILDLLNTSHELMMTAAPQQGRLSKDAALLFKARVALFEATWEKYHQTTAFTPGNPKWMGAATYPDFTFSGGNIESEYNYFFEVAIAASDSIASTHTLYEDYQKLFNDTKGDVMASSEVILAKYYKLGVNGHSATHYLKRTGAGTGFTRSLVESFLTSDGLPIYADPSYQSDKIMYYMLQNRDKRLTQSVKVGGLIKDNNDTIVYYKPQIYSSGNQGTPTGYEVKKWISEEIGQDETATSGTSSTPIFRAAEAYLIYLEAYYERYGSLGGKCDEYWKALRNRAGVNNNYPATIAATDLSKENDLAAKSRGTEVSTTLYNIRRERRSEFIAEGMRLMDLKRWRSLDNMTNYQIEGFNLWDDIYKIYSNDQIKIGQTVSSSSLGVYLRPYQIVSSSIVYDGYTFPKQHYLEPIPVSEIIMTNTNGLDNSPIYQNPGWPSKIAGPADYDFDCD